MAEFRMVNSGPGMTTKGWPVKPGDTDVDAGEWERVLVEPKT